MSIPPRPTSLPCFQVIHLSFKLSCRRDGVSSALSALLCSGKSRSLFCYDCQVPFTSVPSLQLPFQLHIITHAAERFTKATGVHAAVLCKGQVHLHR